jgi:hypothetical protein
MKKSELRNIIKEEIESLFKNNGRLTPYLSEEEFANKWRTKEFTKPINEMGNALPPKDSNWFEFAETFDIGMLDLNNFAADMKFKGFRDLDISINPKNLYARDPKKFTKAIKSASLMASDMTGGAIQKAVKGLWP